MKASITTYSPRAALSGAVRTDSAGAVVGVEGEPGDVAGFLDRLRREPPPLAVIEALEIRDIPTAGGTGFRIADTSHRDGGRTLGAGS